MDSSVFSSFVQVFVSGLKDVVLTVIAIAGFTFVLVVAAVAIAYYRAVAKVDSFRSRFK